MASAVLRLRHPLVFTVLRRTVAKVLSMGLVVRMCFQMLGREVVEAQQAFTVLDQALCGLVVFCAVALR